MENKKPKKNLYKKKQRTLSFAYEKGYKALDYLERMGENTVGGKSGYIVKLLLEDMQRNGEQIGE